MEARATVLRRTWQAPQVQGHQPLAELPRRDAGNAVAVGPHQRREIYSPLLLPVPKVAPPYPYRCAFYASSAACSLACADDLERTILLEGADTVAAFFAEPVIGTSAAGVTPHPGLLPPGPRNLRRTTCCSSPTRCSAATGGPAALRDHGMGCRARHPDHRQGIGSGYAPSARCALGKVRDFQQGAGPSSTA